MHISISYRVPSENEIWNLGKLLWYAYIDFLSDPIGKRNLESGKAIMVCIYSFPIGSHRIGIVICIDPFPIRSHRKTKFEIWGSYSVLHFPNFSGRIEGKFFVCNIDRN